MINIEYENPAMKELGKALFAVNHPNWLDLYFFVKLEYNYYRKKGYTRKEIKVSLTYGRTLDRHFDKIKVTAKVSTPHTHKRETKIIGVIYHDDYSKERNELMEKAQEIIKKLVNIKKVISKLES